MSLKDTLLAYKPKVEIVEGREDMQLYVRVTTGAGRYQLEKKFTDTDKHNHLVEAALVGVCNKDGELIFAQTDRAVIQEMPSDLLQDIFVAVLTINKMKAEDNEEAVKQLEATTD